MYPYLFMLLILLQPFVCAAVDRTREDRAIGADVVQAVVDIIRENCIYPNDRVFLRRLAFVESHDGQNTDTFRPNYFGGIWQVDKSMFDTTKNCYSVDGLCNIIKEKLGIRWQSVVWSDLTKPLYSGLAASLYLQHVAGNSTPGVIQKQAQFWVDNYHRGKTVAHFISEVDKIQNPDCEIDLAFILDGSGSIGFIHFLHMLDFVKNVTKQFKIGPNDVEVALVSFSDYGRVEFGFGSHTSHRTLENDIDYTSYDAGGTNTASGIRMTRNDVYRNGARKGAAKVGLVITDGVSNSFNKTIEEAFKAKEAGIVLFALGIGSVNEEELNSIASTPNCTHVFFLSGFSEIDSLIYEIKKAACRAPVVISPTGIDGNATGSPFPNITNPIYNITTQHNISTITHTVIKDSIKTPGPNVIEVTVNCGIVHVYMSYDNPHPSPVLYGEKLTATDEHPAVLYLNKTVDGRMLYMTYVGTHLPPDVAELKKCNSSDAHYVTTFAHVNKTGVEVVCRENGHERECTISEIQQKFKKFVCTSSTGINKLPVPNPCTTAAIQNNEVYHPHPYDDTKFIKCDYQMKMYITQCPNGERYHEGSHSCGSSSQSVATGNKLPLDPHMANPCTSQALLQHRYFFAYEADNSRFIHCDVWGKAWVMECPSSLVWNQAGQSCIENSHTSTNPCTKEQLARGITMFPHTDPHKYIHCDNGLNPWVQSCIPNTVFNFATQNCIWEKTPVG